MTTRREQLKYDTFLQFKNILNGNKGVEARKTLSGFFNHAFVLDYECSVTGEAYDAVELLEKLNSLPCERTRILILCKKDQITMVELGRIYMQAYAVRNRRSDIRYFLKAYKSRIKEMLVHITFFALYGEFNGVKF